MARVQLYTKRDCSLCDEAKKVLLPVAEQEGCSVEMIDITTSQDLMDAYGEEIPVVAIEGVKAFRYRIDDVERLRALLRRANKHED